jgi:hypothetical protein
VKILSWPFQMPGLTISTTLAIMLSLGIMVPLSGFTHRLSPDTVVGPPLVGFGATALIGLYALLMVRLP